MSYRSDKVEYEYEQMREQLDIQCKEAMNILNDHFGSEDIVEEAMNLKETIEYYEDKIKDLKSILDKMEEIEKDMPGYSPEAYDIAGDR